jgi:hypothetical protein
MLTEILLVSEAPFFCKRFAERGEKNEILFKHEKAARIHISVDFYKVLSCFLHIEFKNDSILDFDTV